MGGIKDSSPRQLGSLHRFPSSGASVVSSHPLLRVYVIAKATFNELGKHTSSPRHAPTLTHRQGHGANRGEAEGIHWVTHGLGAHLRPSYLESLCHLPARCFLKFPFTGKFKQEETTGQDHFENGTHENHIEYTCLQILNVSSLVRRECPYISKYKLIGRVSCDFLLKPNTSKYMK